LTRGFQLSQPGRLYFDEFYAQDACLYLGWAEAVCGRSTEVAWMHPPLGKWLISGGIALFGFEPIAWRLTASLAGIVMIGLVFVLTRRLTGSVLAASLAGGLLALDPLAIATSRIAMLDVFSACAGVATVLFATQDAQDSAARVGRWRAFIRPWRVAAGVGAGIAVATKWSGILALGVAVFLVLAKELSARNPSVRAWPMRLRSAGFSIVVWLVLVPSCVYMLAYAGRFDGSILSVPWQEGAWIRQFVDRQLAMLTFHFGLDANHPYASPAWSWLLAKRPVVFLLELRDAQPVGGSLREILVLVNPLIWVPGMVAAGAAAWVAVRSKRLWSPALVIAASVAGTYLPWLILAGGRAQVFAYYVLPTLPFLAVALGWAAATMPPRAARFVAGGLAVVSVAALIFWSPLVYGWSIDYDTWHARMTFTDCGPQVSPSAPYFPRLGYEQPPSGWCWI
jgi:dolichyl-phosphate-mannose-protein mannosyltransferase